MYLTGYARYTKRPRGPLSLHRRIDFGGRRYPKGLTSYDALVYKMSVLKIMGARPQRDERIVRSGKIVTAAGVSAGIDLALWLAGEISGRARAEAI